MRNRMVEIKVASRAGGKLLVSLLGAVMCSGMLLAADQSLTWTAGATPATLGAGGELAFTYDANDKVQSLFATVAAGDTITLSGEAIDFAADAVVTLSGPGNFVVENTLTGVNGLVVTNAQNAALLDFIDPTLLNSGASAAFKTVFPGCNIDDITILYANQYLFDGKVHDGITYAGVGNPQINYPHVVRRMTQDGVKWLTCQMQAFYYSGGKPITKTALLELKQSGADVVGRTVGGYYPWASVEGADMLNLYQQWLSNPDTNVNTQVFAGGYRIGHLMATWSGAPSVSLRGNLSGLGGALTVAKGAKADILGATVAPPSISISGQFLVGDADLTIGGAVAGDHNGALVLQATKVGSYTVTLSNTHANKMVAALGRSGRTDGSKGEAFIDICGRLVIRGDSAAGKTMICKAQSWSAFPTNGIVEVRDGGVLDLTGLTSRGSPNGGGARQNDSATIRVYKGGLVKHNNNWTTWNEQKIELRGGTFESQRASGSVTFSYQNNMLFEDGGALTSKGGTYWSGNSSAPVWKVRGTSPSSMEAPLQILGTGNNTALRVMTLDVADVTGDDQPDFIFKQEITRYASFLKAGINKTGIGTALLMGVFDLNNGFQVSCGTLMLGISNGWTGGALTMQGGTFAVSNNTVNALPMLKVGNRGGKIRLGEGATLSFDDSSSQDAEWMTNIVVECFREGALRFGDSADALTERQQNFLRTSEGRKLHLLSNGYVTAIRGFEMVIR